MLKIKNMPKHVAIILDGNGRWAKRRGLPRTLGHYNGGLNLAKIATYANDLNLEQLTVYAFSTENWNRPKEEVDYLMSKPIEMIHKNKDKIIHSNIKISFAGRKDRIPTELFKTIEELEIKTSKNTGLKLIVALDYGAYDELLTAISKMKEITQEELEKNLMIKEPVDLLIRTSGEQRLSNFLLWQNAYAEFYFTKKHWPSFNKRELNKALKTYSKRNRRFGGLNK
ncbi:Undecaprenyl pyrophosphate synthetase [Alteracholeplasma palmae J233]|uniref:Isoprenyl transferase n=1 Tax=Alteracholeplasma palmae (strain ATCC 49389 / J233) TaxID=1318466 RepID=U4KJV6_ALTPJ|nr:polyprenyl diphosphate synthase [Alteracholeplasma palmae]CCV63854.1 Undecaprenyl pyrophosphate synthetase [Alteracholeplasma palmae J233]